VIGFLSSKVGKDYQKASVCLRLLCEALAKETESPILIMRVLSTGKFENGSHASGMAIDVILGNPVTHIVQLSCSHLNQKFMNHFTKKPIFTFVEEPSNGSNGKRMLDPHIHIQIPFEWKMNPNLFLEAYGYLQHS
jgi:hypothetical protein